MSKRPFPSSRADAENGGQSGGAGTEHWVPAAVDATSEVTTLIDQVSHDLRSALNGIQSWAYVLDHSLDAPTAPVQRALTGLRTAMQQQVTLIQHLEEAVRLLADESEAEWEAVDLAAAMAQAMESAKPVAEARRVTLADVLVHRDQGAGSRDDVLVQADPRRLEPLLRHLVLHCLKQARNGDTIDAHLEPTANHVKLRLTESRATSDRVKERLSVLSEFFRRDIGTAAAAPARQSSALLLARRMAELHGASLGAEPSTQCEQDGQTACIAVTFPRVPPGAAIDPAVNSTVYSSPSPAPSSDENAGG
ncbi:HAMP domain-containing histidine kinase [Cupriavidus gilardii]|uniref:sensor histidine kinase n=1 Tax=Cupriavidus gilardii TaxID=82541 RepID=UPI001ABE0226|nr:HAMP domain-containing sensor histidine kinase [Cupriavidus gilardii]MBO4122461.1 HAMP domain-containing histidine kinase [Cupriavidus gilardii]